MRRSCRAFLAIALLLPIYVHCYAQEGKPRLEVPRYVSFDEKEDEKDENRELAFKLYFKAENDSAAAGTETVLTATPFEVTVKVTVNDTLPDKEDERATPGGDYYLERTEIVVPKGTPLDGGYCELAFPIKIYLDEDKDEKNESAFLTYEATYGQDKKETRIAEQKVSIVNYDPVKANRTQINLEEGYLQIIGIGTNVDFIGDPSLSGVSVRLEQDFKIHGKRFRGSKARNNDFVTYKSPKNKKIQKKDATNIENTSEAIFNLLKEDKDIDTDSTKRIIKDLIEATIKKVASYPSNRTVDRVIAEIEKEVFKQDTNEISGDKRVFFSKLVQEIKKEMDSDDASNKVARRWPGRQLAGLWYAAFNSTSRVSFSQNKGVGLGELRRLQIEDLYYAPFGSQSDTVVRYSLYDDRLLEYELQVSSLKLDLGLIGFGNSIRVEETRSLEIYGQMEFTFNRATPSVKSRETRFDSLSFSRFTDEGELPAGSFSPIDDTRVLIGEDTVTTTADRSSLRTTSDEINLLAMHAAIGLRLRHLTKNGRFYFEGELFCGIRDAYRTRVRPGEDDDFFRNSYAALAFKAVDTNAGIVVGAEFKNIISSRIFKLDERSLISDPTLQFFNVYLLKTINPSALFNTP